MWQIWGREQGYTGVWWGKLRENDHLINLGVDGRIILKRIKTGWGVDWIYLAQDRGR